MDKTYADKIITEYMEKIFGFALTKTMNTDKAEELASRITFDVYTSLLKSGEVHNINGYIYRVASNVYARFVDEEVKGRRNISLDEVGMSLACETDFIADLEKDETYMRLRREISYLGRIQREIVVMYYFQKLKQNQIAERLNIPLGTVKWHLHDARSQIKEGMNKMDKMREKGTLGMNPIKFSWMGMSGNSGPEDKNTAYYLKKLISQNIAYAAYHEPKTITEIAQELGTSAAFIEDEIATLEEYSFMEKLPNGKYQTNIYITETTKEELEARHELCQKYAKLVREHYVPLVFDAMKDYKAKKIYTPNDDFNFLMWSIVTCACKHKFYLNEGRNAHASKYYMKRKDGSEYIALAGMKDDFTVDYDVAVYSSPNNMTRGSDNPKFYSWQMDSYYDSRKNDHNDNRDDDYIWLYEFMTGKISKTPEHADKFKRLYDKGYIVSEDGTEYVNMVISASHEELNAALPEPPKVLKKASKEFDEEMANTHTTEYPAHMQELHRAMSANNCMSDQNFVTYVLKLLVDDGTLKPLSDTQKQSVNTIMFCDTLPK